MTEPPRRRWLSRSPNRSIIVDTEQLKLRVGWRAQMAVIGPVAKWAAGIVIAGIAALVAWLEVC